MGFFESERDALENDGCICPGWIFFEGILLLAFFWLLRGRKRALKTCIL